MTSPGRSGFSRETRLLAATIAVSLVVLLVLSRFRFPDASADYRDGAAAQPLARFAARAAFDDLSLAIRELSDRVGGSLLVVRLGVDAQSALHDSRDAGYGARLLPALRVRDDAAVVLVPAGARVVEVLGVPGAVTTLAHDTTRGLTLVRVPSARAQVLSVREGQQLLAAPGYVAVAEASGSGPSLRPIFVGRSDALADPRWDGTLLSIGRGASGDIGAPVFTLEGRLAGWLASTDDEPALVPAEIILASVDRMLRGGVAPTGDIGIAAQTLDARMAAATGVSSGAAVAAVSADGPGAGVVTPGEVITAVNGVPVPTADALRLRVARAAPGTVLVLTVRREGTVVTAPVTVRQARAVNGGQAPAGATRPTQGPRPLGLVLRAIAGRGSEVTRVQAGSLADVAGLQVGDVVVAIGAARSPSPDDIAAAVEALKSAGAVFLSVDRGGQPRLVALQR